MRRWNMAKIELISSKRLPLVFIPDTNDSFMFTFEGWMYPCPVGVSSSLIKKILVSPELVEAKKILDAGSSRHQKQSNLFCEAIVELLKYSVTKKSNPLYWMNDKRDALRLCKNARELTKVAKQLNEFYGVNGAWLDGRAIDENLQPRKFPAFLPEFDFAVHRPAKDIPRHIQILAEFLAKIAEAPRKKGRRGEDIESPFICSLEDLFRANLGKPCYRAIALLWQAASSKKKTVATVKTTITRYRKGKQNSAK
jgi:hypothetical protein